MTVLYLVVGILVLAVVIAVGLVTTGRRRGTTPPPVDSARRAPGAPTAGESALEGQDPAAVTTLERPEGTASRLVRLRQRLAGTQGGFGRGLLALLSRDRLDEDTWEAIEDTLLTADVGVAPTQQLVENLRTRLRVGGKESGDPRAVLRDELLSWSGPTWTAGSGLRRRRPARRRTRGGGQRHGQDDHRGQAGADPGRRGPYGRAGRGRHLPRRGRRPARHLGRAGRRRRRARTRGLRPGERRVRGRAGGRSTGGSTPCWSTPPAGCRTRPA